jgi:hypothetical protein
MLVDRPLTSVDRGMLLLIVLILVALLAQIFTNPADSVRPKGVGSHGEDSPLQSIS